MSCVKSQASKAPFFLTKVCHVMSCHVMSSITALLSARAVIEPVIVKCHAENP
jgi:hypothetical protein